MKPVSLSETLKHKKAFRNHEKDFKDKIQQLQLKLLRIQQGVWHKKSRVIIVFEGFDAAGKGGAIRKITEALDPRGVRVHAIGPPLPEEQHRHWLYRFWTKIPEPGTIAIFDRSWYGRVLVERAEKLTPKKDWSRAYSEINQFEKMLQNDGVKIIKIFLAITKDEQLKRFEDRLNDPYKQWKITKDDLRARKNWNGYVKAVDQMLKETGQKHLHWNLLAGNDKIFARKETLTIITSRLASFEKWITSRAAKLGKRKLVSELQKAAVSK